VSVFTEWLTGLETVYRATDTAAREAIYRFRYEVYVAELGKAVANADHERRWVKDPEDEQPGTVLFYTGSPTAVTGSLRVQVWTPGTVPPAVRSRYSLDGFPGIEQEVVAESARLMVSRTRRGQLILPALARAGYELICAELGGNLVFANCASGLVRAYRRLGYRPYSGRLIPSDDGLRIPLVMVMSDLAYFQEQGSPLTALLKRYFGKGSRPYPDLAPYRPLLGSAGLSFKTDAHAVWQELHDDLLVQEDQPPPFLRDLPPAALKQLATRGFIVEVASDQVVTRENLVEKELFVILDGVAEVTAHDQRVALLHKGDVFGEIAFFMEAGRRTATIRTLAPCKFLVLRRRFLEELLRDDPAMAATLLLNLSRILAGRLAGML
jgi:hypothetical protein